MPPSRNKISNSRPKFKNWSEICKKKACFWHARRRCTANSWTGQSTTKNKCKNWQQTYEQHRHSTKTQLLHISQWYFIPYTENSLREQCESREGGLGQVDPLLLTTALPEWHRRVKFGDELIDKAKRSHESRYWRITQQNSGKGGVLSEPDEVEWWGTDAAARTEPVWLWDVRKNLANSQLICQKLRSFL